MSKTAYANSQKQPLSQHLFAVGCVAALIIERLLVRSPDEIPHLKKAAFIAGCLHDIGKLDSQFIAWLDQTIDNNPSGKIESQDDGLHIDSEQFSFDKHPRHNEISLWLIQFIDLLPMVPNRTIKAFIEHVVYWHHSKPFRQKAFVNIGDIQCKLAPNYGKDNRSLQHIIEAARHELAEIDSLQRKYPDRFNVDLTQCKIQFSDDRAESIMAFDLPKYKKYELKDDFDKYVDQAKLNAKMDMLRTCVISADRLVSALSAKALNSHIENGTLNSLVEVSLPSSAQSSTLSEHINDCLAGFTTHGDSERNHQQSKVAEQLIEVEGIAVLNGPAGCGKSKIALEWAKRSAARKVIWVCPRVQVCEGLYEDLSSQEYLPKASIEICTGEFKHRNVNGKPVPTVPGQEFSGDIVLTTIDQVISGITTHTNATALVDFLHHHVVFDEYHEYITMPAFNLLFAELIQAKKLMGDKANTLLVSATPNFIFLELLLDIDAEDISDIESFNKSTYGISFDEFDDDNQDQSNPLFKRQANNTIVISNTATTAQQAYIINQGRENAIVFHSKFNTHDKQVIFNKVFQNFKQQGTKKFALLRSGPIVQASLNITCDRMVTEFTSAENYLQRLGRLDRFGENEKTNLYIMAVPKKISASDGNIVTNCACASFLKRLHSYHSAWAWYQFLQENLPENQPEQPLTIDAIYQLYRQFYQSEAAKQAVKQDLLTALADSVDLIKKKIHDPIRFIRTAKADGKKRLKKSSLRGDSRFVQMAVYDIDAKGKGKLDDTYAIDDRQNNNGVANSYTASLDSIRQSGLLDYVAKKHGRIDPENPIKAIPANKINQRKQLLVSAAVEPEYPIYLSYTPSDMRIKFGESTPHKAAVYYVKGSKQVIGAMSRDKIPKR